MSYTGPTGGTLSDGGHGHNQRRSEMVAEFSRMILAKGFRSVRMEQVADSLDVSIGVLYVAFESREILVTHALQIGHLQLADVVPTAWLDAVAGHAFEVAQ